MKHTTKYKHEQKANYTQNQIYTIVKKIDKVEELYNIPGIYQYIESNYNSWKTNRKQDKINEILNYFTDDGK